ncbi:MAG: asparagine synthase (glutamine-hydrolyzing) [Rhodospirillales bacterium]|nr:asparagine synthase (glutamine-hydrolyzing) [Rhodospirillales bacterium]
MCGIAGLFLPRVATTKIADMDAMLGILAHRGPDGEGRYVSDDRRYQAGFRRLAIIDLETSDQPIVERSTGRVLSGNGEIYNYLELRKRQPDYPYQTYGDMESVLALHAARGADFYHDLNGMFALALFEQADHRLTLVRDRLGIKPLYWSELPGGGILYASEIKALFASGLVRPQIDESTVSSYLAHGYVPDPLTLYKGIHQLPPGHVLCAEGDGSVSVERYWRATPATDLPSGAGDIASHLTDILEDSLRLQMRSDVPIGALLSGGIDSGLMVALAAQQSSRPINTFTVRFEGALVDESPLAGQVAERYQTNHQVVDLPAAGAGTLLPKLAWYCDEPLNDASVLPNFMIEEALGHSLKVALNGTGGDEIFAGYGRYFQLPVEKRYLGFPKALRNGLIEPLCGLFSPMTAWRLARAEKFREDPGGYLHDHSTLFPAPIRDLIGNRMDLTGLEQSRLAGEFESQGQAAMLYADLGSYLPYDLLCLLDRTSMAVGVEGRVPFLDHRLVEAALGVPEGVRTPGGRQKALQREMARPYLPESVIDAPKQGFASPVPAWMSAGLGKTAASILKSKNALERGWWSARGIERLLAEPRRHGFRLYQLLMLELAIRIHIDNPPRTTPPSDPLEAYADAA